MAALSGLAAALESYRGRDRLVRLGRSAAGGPGSGPELSDWKLRPERGGALRIPRRRGVLPAGLRPCPLAVDKQVVPADSSWSGIFQYQSNPQVWTFGIRPDH